MAQPNIYPNVATQLAPRLKDVLLQYARDGQIDCDRVGWPYLISVRQLGGKNVEAYVARNAKLASIILNTRARTQEPTLSWDPNDGYRFRSGGGAQVTDRSRAERQMRESENPYSHLVEQLLETM